MLQIRSNCKKTTWIRPLPHLDPRRDLCVVEVTRSACWKGEGTAPAATSPLMWAMSARRYAFSSPQSWNTHTPLVWWRGNTQKDISLKENRHGEAVNSVLLISIRSPLHTTHFTGRSMPWWTHPFLFLFVLLSKLKNSGLDGFFTQHVIDWAQLVIITTLTA